MPIHSKGDVVIRPAATTDAEALTRIYNHYVTETVVTFEEETVPPSEMARRIQESQSASLPWLVAEWAGEIAGFAYARKWNGRNAYRFSTELAIYLDPVHGRRGIGSKLYGQLLPVLKSLGIHAVIAGIALPNEASVRLHEKFGFQKIAHFKEVGFKLNRWIDVGYWEHIF